MLSDPRPPCNLHIAGHNYRVEDALHEWRITHGIQLAPYGPRHPRVLGVGNKEQEASSHCLLSMSVTDWSTWANLDHKREKRLIAFV